MKFFLIRPQDKESSIFIDVAYKKNRVRLSTGIVIKTTSWDQKKQRVNRNENHYVSYNNHLVYLNGKIDSFIIDLKLKKENLSSDELKNKLKAIIDPEFIEHNPVQDSNKLTELFIHWKNSREKNDQFKISTVKNYKSLLNHLYKYEKYKNKILFPSDMNLEFYQDFLAYLNQKAGLINNSAGSVIKTLKAFLNELHDRGIHINPQFKKFKVYKDPEPPKFALSDDEIQSIKSVQLDSESLIIVRDLFLLQIELTLRISDLMQIAREHIDLGNKTINLVQIKTGKNVTIPLSKKALEVLDKYDYNLPKISELKFNNYIKEIAKLAGINDKFELVRYYGKKRMVILKPKYELISSHTARITGITRLIRKGVNPRIIMEISGHRKLETLEKYIKLAKNDALEIIREALDR